VATLNSGGRSGKNSSALTRIATDPEEIYAISAKGRSSWLLSEGGDYNQAKEYPS
jgi:hypothetical protein